MDADKIFGTRWLQEMLFLILPDCPNALGLVGWEKDCVNFAQFCSWYLLQFI
jgi:hypothetical protein